MKTISNGNITFQDERESANVVMLVIILLLLFLTNLCLLLAKTSQYLMMPEFSKALRKIGNMFLFASLLLFMIVFIIDMILQYSEDVKRPIYYAVYEELTSKIKLLSISSLALYALLYV